MLNVYFSHNCVNDGVELVRARLFSPHEPVQIATKHSYLSERKSFVS